MMRLYDGVQWLGVVSQFISLISPIEENNVYTAETPYRTGDVFRIAVRAGVVRYYKNGGLFQSSLKSPTCPFFADASFLTVGGEIDNAVIGALAVSASADWTTYQHDSAHTGYSAESQINTANARTLAQAWSLATGDWVTGTPIVAYGVVYIGSFVACNHCTPEFSLAVVAGLTFRLFGLGGPPNEWRSHRQVR